MRNVISTDPKMVANRFYEIVNHWSAGDLFSILNQIGALPTASPSASGMPPVLVQ